MAITATSWNAENAFGDPNHARQAVEHVLEISPDVAVFPEAYDVEMLGSDYTRAQSIESFQRDGYQVVDAPYDDEFHHGTKHGFMAIFRDGSSELLRTGNRTSLSIEVPDFATSQVVRVVGLHLDHKEEEKRQRQAKEIITAVTPIELPTILLGDFNAMHGRHPRARILRTPLASWAANKMPESKKRREHARCVIGMANGGTMRLFEDAGFWDVDVTGQGTAPHFTRLIQIDHIMASDQLRYNDFRVERYRRSSDHQAVTATLEVVS